MKKFAFLPLAALAVAAACGDTATKVVGPDAPSFSHLASSIQVSHNGQANSNVAVSWTVTSGEEYQIKLECVSTCSSSLESTNNITSSPYTFLNVPAGEYRAGVKKKTADAGGYGMASSTFTLVAPPSDDTAPVITREISGTLGNNGWYTSDVTLTWTVTENESPASLVTTGCVDQNITADQAAVTYSCSASSDGGSAGPVEVTIKRDATPPTNINFVDGPAAGGSYYFGSVPAAPTCTADDATSGLASCAVTGYSTAVGEHTLTATATDNAGNQSTAQRFYTVRAWTLSGFYSPVNMQALNTGRAGSTIPLKFEIFAENELTSTSAIASFRVRTVSCTDPAIQLANDPIEEYSSGGTSLRYDTNGGQFIQNWQTSKSAGCYVVTLTTSDGSSISANFKTTSR